MKLKRETVKAAYIEFGERFGWPRHAAEDENKKRIIDFDYAELKKLFSEEGFPSALSVAKAQARKFPCIADFYRGFEPPAIQDEKTRRKYTDAEKFREWNLGGKYNFEQKIGMYHETFGKQLRIDLADLGIIQFSRKYHFTASHARDVLEAYGY